MYLEALGTKILILNSMEAVTDLLEKRGANYSHRPELVMGCELMGLSKVRLLPVPRESHSIRRTDSIHDALRQYVEGNQKTYADVLWSRASKEVLSCPGRHYGVAPWRSP